MEKPYELNPRTYDWCVRAFDRVRNLLGVRIKLHHRESQIEDGDIFLFNHFARMETFIPQYLIYKETGAYCRSIAAAQFFKGSDRFTEVLYDLGAVPNDHPDLMPLLARDILKGRKIVIFPEGGMVKDRQVLDDEGNYSVYSRSARSRRRHHTGAARLAIGLQIIKTRVLEARDSGDQDLLDRWTEQLDLPSVEALVESARRPVTIVPANITFYPLRVSDNVLRRGAELLHGKLSQRAVEELIVEGNLFFKTTDMDIRLGDAMRPLETWTWWEHLPANFLARRLDQACDIFDGNYLQRDIVRRAATKSLRASISRLRNRYMRDIYREVTINSSHLASSVILKTVEQGRQSIQLDVLKQIVYISIKKLQSQRNVHLHRSICNPTIYRELLNTQTPQITQFLRSAVAAELVELDTEEMRFTEKLALDHEFDSVRLENPIEVYANEVGPIAEVASAVAAAMINVTLLSAEDRARYSFDDERIALEWDSALFSKPEHLEMNERETATMDPSPFLFEPAGDESERSDIGILLIHGFLASPAEVRGFGEKVCDAGFTVLGVRLKGHGTSPWDLRERSWSDWYASVERGLAILRGLGKRVIVIGFSTGATLALLLAARRSGEVLAVASVCAPLKFRNKNMRFVPLMHGANRIVRWLSSYEGVMPFRLNESEHPHINYRNMPIRSLYELTRLVATLKGEIKAIECDVCIVQSSADRVVDPASATMAYEMIQADEKSIHWIASDRHGIVNENIGGTHKCLLDFVAAIASKNTAALRIPAPTA